MRRTGWSPDGLNGRRCFAALRDCYDPELPVNIVDLGLIYTVAADPGREVQTGVSQAARGSRDDHDLAGLPIPRHDYGTGAEPAGGRPRDQRRPWSTWYGSRLDTGSHQPEGTRTTRHRLEQICPYYRTAFSTTVRSFSPCDRQLADKLFKTAERMWPLSRYSGMLFQTFLTPSGSSTKAKIVPAAAMARPVLRLPVASRTAPVTSEPAATVRTQFLSESAIESAVALVLQGFGCVLHGGCYLLRNVCDSHSSLSLSRETACVLDASTSNSRSLIEIEFTQTGAPRRESLSPCAKLPRIACRTIAALFFSASTDCRKISSLRTSCSRMALAAAQNLRRCACAARMCGRGSPWSQGRPSGSPRNRDR